MTTEATGTGDKTDLRLPTRRYLSREEAAAWLGVCVDTFARFDIPYCDFGPRCRRWDVMDIIAYAEQTKVHDSARTSAPKTQRRGHKCVSTSARARRTGGSPGTTGTEGDIAEVLELKIGS
jgi:hypothetical protein